MHLGRQKYSQPLRRLLYTSIGDRGTQLNMRQGAGGTWFFVKTMHQ
jgi:hypothetical protein